MSGKFDHTSANRLNVCDPRLIDILKEVIKVYDFRVMCGYRDKDAQNEAVKNGTSKLQWPNSPHNSMPSMAVDILPNCLIDPETNKIDWDNPQPFIELAELVFAEADKQGVHIRWGGDWLMDGSKTKKDDWDKPHFEVMEKKV